MMDCKKIRELLTVHAMDRSNEEERALRDHISGCKECAREQALFGDLDRMLQDACRGDEPVMAEERSDLDLGINDDPVSPAKRSGRTLLAALAACLMAGCMIMGYFLGTLSSEIRYLDQELNEQRAENATLKSKVEQSEKALAEARASVRGPRTVVYQLFNRKPNDQPVVKDAGYRLRTLPMTRHIFKEENDELY